MKLLKRTAILVLLLSTAACQKSIFEPRSVAPATLRDVAALRLGFRYEADVPPPAVNPQTANPDEKNGAVQADFDANRPQEILERTIASPNKQRLLAVYQRAGDRENTFRLDMYTAEGKFLRRVSSETMAVDFPDIIVWSPDSQSAAFVAIAREGAISSLTPLPSANSNANTSLPKTSDANSNVNANIATPTPVAPAIGDAAPNVVTFRTEQIYICNSEGLDLKPLTQSEGRIYYYFVWAPDSSMLVALAATAVEWRRLEEMAAQRGERLVPMGRPRIVEKNGRERLLDDNLTSVHPVWSPDSAKVAAGFLKDQIRIYDAIGDQPTQAAVPIRNELLFSSQAFDQKVSTDNANVDANSNANTAAPATPSTTLPDERTLVSFQPITTLEWVNDSELYFQTGYIKQFVSGDGARSSLRWHRLILSPQAITIK